MDTPVCNIKPTVSTTSTTRSSRDNLSESTAIIRPIVATSQTTPTATVMPNIQSTPLLSSSTTTSIDSSISIVTPRQSTSHDDLSAPMILADHSDTSLTSIGIVRGSSLTPPPPVPAVQSTPIAPQTSDPWCSVEGTPRIDPVTVASTASSSGAQSLHQQRMMMERFAGRPVIAADLLQDSSESEEDILEDSDDHVSVTMMMPAPFQRQTSAQRLAAAARDAEMDIEDMDSDIDIPDIPGEYSAVSSTPKIASSTYSFSADTTTQYSKLSSVSITDITEEEALQHEADELERLNSIIKKEQEERGEVVEEDVASEADDMEELHSAEEKRESDRILLENQIFQQVCGIHLYMRCVLLNIMK